MLRTWNRLLAFLALAFPVLCAARTVPAQSTPHLANGVAQFAPNQSDFTGTGHATHLGSYTEVGNVVFTPTATPGVFAVDGWSHYTAANGDLLYAVIHGSVDFTSGAITATATYAGGTGRFTNATGSSVLTGQMLGGGALAIAAAGTLGL
jgi:hypothetical protein